LVQVHVVHQKQSIKEIIDLENDGTYWKINVMNDKKHEIDLDDTNIQIWNV
jgi:hypothetical protein